MTSEPNWNSLRRHVNPDWMREAKFGIYTHWGAYSVPACGPNVSWYPCNMYRRSTEQHRFHVEHYGDPKDFGYKDFIPMFTGEKFDADEWAELFRLAGARFAGPVAEHHDGFSMWDSKVNPWNAKRMGPRRDVVGELEKAVKARGMKFLCAMHHFENWLFYPHWDPSFDTFDPKWEGLYGEPHNREWNTPGMIGDWADGKHFEEQAQPTKAFLDTWLEKCKEVIDGYGPDMMWFDFGLKFVPDSYKTRYLAYYLNEAQKKGQQPLVTYKWQDLPVGMGMVDLELGSFDELTYFEWLTDTTIDLGEAWGYQEGATYKSATSLLHYLIDNVSKNGYLLLNVGPTREGVIPDEARQVLKQMGDWLRINGEAIYETTPWYAYGQGPTRLLKSGPFNEAKLPEYTEKDVRFTQNGGAIYAICLGWPKGETVLDDLPRGFYPDEIASVSMLGDGAPLAWKMEGRKLTVQAPKTPPPPCKHAYVYKIERRQ